MSSNDLSEGQQLGAILIFISIPFCVSGLWWWPLTIPGVLLVYFGFMLSCFT